MIARTWHGRVPASKADAYYEYLLRTGLSDYRTTEGNRGVLVQRRVEEDVAHFVLTTIWDSVDAIKRFADEDYELARYYPEDDEYLLERGRYVTHAEVLTFESGGGTRSQGPTSVARSTRPFQPLPFRRRRILYTK